MSTEESKQDEMKSIHKGMIIAFKRYLDGIADGEIVPRASMLNTIRAFLRDNGMTAMNEPKDPFKAMEEALDGIELPTFDDNPRGGRMDFK